jgi:hypothetical protein
VDIPEGTRTVDIGLQVEETGIEVIEPRKLIVGKAKT